jgi:hypothetical protein
MMSARSPIRKTRADGSISRDRPDVPTRTRSDPVQPPEKLMTLRAMAVLASLLVLAGCETPTTQRYAISAENNQAIKALGATGIGVAAFKAPAQFNPNCRAAGALQVADGMTHTQYIQKAFEAELKIAGAFAQGAPRVVLSGTVDRLEFSSTRGLVGGSWSIDLSLASSNGRKIAVKEYYEFSSGFSAPEACRNTAEAFSRAVQNLVGKSLADPGFPALLQ